MTGYENTWMNTSILSLFVSLSSTILYGRYLLLSVQWCILYSITSFNLVLALIFIYNMAVVCFTYQKSWSWAAQLFKASNDIDTISERPFFTFEMGVKDYWGKESIHSIFYRRWNHLQQQSVSASALLTLWARPFVVGGHPKALEVSSSIPDLSTLAVSAPPPSNSINQYGGTLLDVPEGQNHHSFSAAKSHSQPLSHSQT